MTCIVVCCYKSKYFRIVKCQGVMWLFIVFNGGVLCLLLEHIVKCTVSSCSKQFNKTLSFDINSTIQYVLLKLEVRVIEQHTWAPSDLFRYKKYISEQDKANGYAYNINLANRQSIVL